MWHVLWGISLRYAGWVSHSMSQLRVPKLQMLKALTFEVTLEAEDVPKPINLPVARPRLLWQRAELEYASSIDMQ